MGAALASGGAQAQGRDHVGAKAPRNAWRLWFPTRQAGPRAHRTGLPCRRIHVV